MYNITFDANSKNYDDLLSSFKLVENNLLHYDHKLYIFEPIFTGDNFYLTGNDIYNAIISYIDSNEIQDSFVTKNAIILSSKLDDRDKIEYIDKCISALKTQNKKFIPLIYTNVDKKNKIDILDKTKNALKGVNNAEDFLVDYKFENKSPFTNEDYYKINNIQSIIKKEINMFTNSLNNFNFVICSDLKFKSLLAYYDKNKLFKELTFSKYVEENNELYKNICFSIMEDTLKRYEIFDTSAPVLCHMDINIDIDPFQRNIEFLNYIKSLKPNIDYKFKLIIDENISSDEVMQNLKNKLLLINDNAPNYPISISYINDEFSYFNQDELLKIEKLHNFCEENNIDFSIYDINNDFTYKEFVNANNKIQEVVSYIKKNNFSPLEAYYYAYSKITNRKYLLEDESDPNYLSRSIISILNNPQICCVGYSNWLKAVFDSLNMPGINVMINTLKYPMHNNNLVFINDPKYKITGAYYSDPTYDSIGDNKYPTMNNILIPLDEIPDQNNLFICNEISSHNFVSTNGKSIRFSDHTAITIEKIFIENNFNYCNYTKKICDSLNNHLVHNYKYFNTYLNESNHLKYTAYSKKIFDIINLKEIVKIDEFENLLINFANFLKQNTTNSCLINEKQSNIKKDINTFLTYVQNKSPIVKINDKIKFVLSNNSKKIPIIKLAKAIQTVQLKDKNEEKQPNLKLFHLANSHYKELNNIDTVKQMILLGSTIPYTAIEPNIMKVNYTNDMPKIMSEYAQYVLHILNKSSLKLKDKIDLAYSMPTPTIRLDISKLNNCSIEQHKDLIKLAMSRLSMGIDTIHKAIILIVIANYPKELLSKDDDILIKEYKEISKNDSNLSTLKDIIKS